MTNRLVHRYVMFAIAGLWGACVRDDASTSQIPVAEIAPPPADAGEPAPETIEFASVKLLVEHNATDEDTGFQAFVDGEPWNRLELRDPRGAVQLAIDVPDRLGTLGLTELFFETSEPPNAEVPIPEVLARLPEGKYEFSGTTVEGVAQRGAATLTHAIPAGPEILAPADEAVVRADCELEIRWAAVRETIDGKPVTITHYQLIVEKADQVEGPGFGGEKLSIFVPADVTSLRVPREFLRPDTEYEFEILAIEASGNQTISSGSFATEAEAH